MSLNDDATFCSTTKVAANLHGWRRDGVCAQDDQLRRTPCLPDPATNTQRDFLLALSVPCRMWLWPARMALATDVTDINHLRGQSVVTPLIARAVFDRNHRSHGHQWE